MANKNNATQIHPALRWKKRGMDLPSREKTRDKWTPQQNLVIACVDI